MLGSAMRSFGGRFGRALSACRSEPTCDHRRTIWNEFNASHANGSNNSNSAGGEHDSFYDSTVQEYAMKPIQVLTLRQMLEFGYKAQTDKAKQLKSARYVQTELPRRLARRLMDLQLLPYIVVTNPHIRRVYDAYYHAFQTLRVQPPVLTEEDNVEFTHMLKRLVDEHGVCTSPLPIPLQHQCWTH